MDRGPGVAASLEEIANILLYLHNHYFAKTVSDPLLSEIWFLRDAKVLSSQLTVLDVTELYHSTSRSNREKDTSSSNSASSSSGKGSNNATASLSYEEFYAWLRAVAEKTYPNAINKSRAFHQLLIEHILPMMSGLSKAPRVAVKSSLVASSAWIQVARFKGLLEHWFYHLLTQEKRSLQVPLQDKHQMSITLGSFYTAVAESSCITADEDVLHVAFIYIMQCLSVIETTSAKAFIGASIKDSTIPLSYNDFLLICCVIFAADINQFFSSSGISSASSLPIGHVARQENVISRIEKLARFYLDSDVLSSLLLVDEELGSYLQTLFATALSSSKSPPPAGASQELELWWADRIHVASVLWYARKSGLLASLPQLDYLFSSLLCAAATIEENAPFVLSKIPMDAVDKLVHSNAYIAVYATIISDVLIDAANRFSSSNNSDYYALSNEIPESSIIPLVYAYPRVLFADATNQSVFWRHAYAPYCSYMLVRSSQALRSVFAACLELDRQRDGVTTSDSVADISSKTQSVSLRSIVELCTTQHVFPTLVPPEEGLQLFGFLIEKTEGYDPALSAPLQKVDILGLYELLFALGQMAQELEDMSDEQRKGMQADKSRSPDERYLKSWNEKREGFSVFSCVKKAWNSFAALLLHLTHEVSIKSSVTMPTMNIGSSRVDVKTNQVLEVSTQSELLDNLFGAGNVSFDSALEIHRENQESRTPAQKLWDAHLEFSVENEFSHMLATLITNVLYKEQPPRWRSDWLENASIDRFTRPVNPGSDAFISTTLDAAIFTSLLFFPHSHQDYNLFSLYKLFQACTAQTLAVAKESQMIDDPNIMALRMVGFFFMLHSRFGIKTRDIYLHLRKTLLADDTFENIVQSSSHEDIARVIFSLEAVQSGLRDLAAQMLVVVNLISTDTIEQLEIHKDALLWEYMLYSTQVHITTNESAASLGLDTNSVIIPVPDMNLMAQNLVWWRVEAAYQWALRFLHKTFVDVKLEAHTIARLARVMASISGLIDVEEASHSEGRDLISYSSYIMFAVTLLLHAGAYSHWDNDGQRLTAYVGMFTQYVSISLSYRFWESGGPTYSAFFSLGGLPVACDPMLQKVIISAALNLFDQQYSLPYETPSNNSASSISMPPRPPLKLWDGPRCIQFLKAFGILSSPVIVQHNLSDVDLIACAWRAMNETLKLHYSAAKLSVWSSNGVVPPLPFKAEIDNIAEFIRKFIETIVTSPNSKATSTIPLIPLRSEILSSLIPILSTNEFHSNILRHSVRPICDFNLRSMEDMLRFGGSKMTQTMDIYRPWLAEEFRLLCLSYDITDAPVLRLPFQLAAKYMSCYGLLKHRTLCKLARGSLHPYWRQWREPAISPLGGSSSAAVLNYNSGLVIDKPQTHLIYIEFEELFIRCAFSMYEAWLSSVGSHKVKAPIAIAETHTKNTDAKATLVHYLNELNALVNPTIVSSSNRPPTANASHWGTDFLHPFASTLQAISVNRESKGFYRSAPTSNARITAAREKLGIIEDAGEYSLLTEPAVASSTNSIIYAEGYNDSEVGELASVVAPDALVPNATGPLSPPMSALRPFSTDANAAQSRGEALIPFPIMSPQRNPPASLDLVSNKLDDAIIRGRDIYLDSILKSRKEASKSTTNSPLSGESSPGRGNIPVKLSIPDRVSNERRNDQSGSSTVEMAKLLEGTKEALWPVFATYCSCGDSLEPGKLSGPNLVTLMSKLNVLTDQTSISDIGILLHQVSTHSTSKGPVAGGVSTDSEDTGLESPLLSFEEFLVFLCTYAHLRYEGTISFPEFHEPTDEFPDGLSERATSPLTSGSIALKSRAADKRKEERMFRMNMRRSIDSWVQNWNNVMITSKPFKRLLVECVMPILNRDPVLAFPEDARHRDLFIQIFSLEVLMSIQKQEDSLLRAFNVHRKVDRERVQQYYIKLDAEQECLDSIKRPQYFIIDALEQIKIVPQKVSRAEVLEFIEDILPSVTRSRDTGRGRSLAEINFPQWQWVLSIVAVKAVNNALGRSSLAKDGSNKAGQGNTTLFVCEVLEALAEAIVQSSGSK